MTPKERVEAFMDEAKGRCYMSAGIGGRDSYNKWFDEKLVEMVRAAEVEALGWAQDAAAMFSINKHSIHPDIPWDKMSESSQMVAHTTCQHVAAEIHDEIERRKTP